MRGNAVRERLDRREDRGAALDGDAAFSSGTGGLGGGLSGHAGAGRGGGGLAHCGARTLAPAFGSGKTHRAREKDAPPGDGEVERIADRGADGTADAGVLGDPQIEQVADVEREREPRRAGHREPRARAVEDAIGHEIDARRVRVDAR